MWQFSILYDLFFSFCLWFAFIYVFVFGLPSAFIYVFVFGLPLFMCLCCLPLSNTNPLTQWIPLPTWLTKTFLNFTLFFFSSTPLVPIMPNYQSTKKKLSLQTLLSLSLYLSYLYNARERVTNTEWQSQSQKAQKETQILNKNTNMKKAQA